MEWSLLCSSAWRGGQSRIRSLWDAQEVYYYWEDRAIYLSDSRVRKEQGAVLSGTYSAWACNEKDIEGVACTCCQNCPNWQFFTLQFALWGCVLRWRIGHVQQSLVLWVGLHIVSDVALVRTFNVLFQLNEMCHRPSSWEWQSVHAIGIRVKRAGSNVVAVGHHSGHIYSAAFCRLSSAAWLDDWLNLFAFTSIVESCQPK